MQTPAHSGGRLGCSHADSHEVKARGSQAGPSEVPLVLDSMLSSAVILLEFSESVIISPQTFSQQEDKHEGYREVSRT